MTTNLRDGFIWLTLWLLIVTAFIEKGRDAEMDKRIRSLQREENILETMPVIGRN